MILLLLALLAAQDPVPLGEGQVLYEFRCKACHEGGQPGIPDTPALSKMGAAAIVRSLERGSMKAMGATLTADEKRVLAEYLVKSPL